MIVTQTTSCQPLDEEETEAREEAVWKRAKTYPNGYYRLRYKDEESIVYMITTPFMPGREVSLAYPFDGSIDNDYGVPVAMHDSIPEPIFITDTLPNYFEEEDRKVRLLPIYDRMTRLIVFPSAIVTLSVLELENIDMSISDGDLKALCDKALKRYQQKISVRNAHRRLM